MNQVNRKTCLTCYKNQPIENFHKCCNYRVAHCKLCSSVKSKVWREKNKDKLKILQKKWYQNNKEKVRANALRWTSEHKKRHLDAANVWMKKSIKVRRLEFINAYGGKCECCGESEHEFLTLEHKMKDGQAHRKQVSTTHRILGHLKKAGWPKDRYGILCCNCNFSTRFGKICPHTLRKNGN